MENFNPELYKKCIAASELLFADMFTELAHKEHLTGETVELNKQDSAMRLYNLTLATAWAFGIYTNVESTGCPQFLDVESVEGNF